VGERPWIPARVLVTADAVGGVFGYAIDLARGLAARGARVTIALMGPAPTPAQRAEAAAIDGVALVDRPFRLEWEDDPWDDVARAGAWLEGLARAVEPEVVHVNGYAHAAIEVGAPVVVAAHSCVASWWRAVHREAAPARYDRYREAVRRGLRAADVVIAPTCAMLDALASEHGAPAIAAVVPNGVDAARFPPGKKEPFALAAGRLWDPAKNVAAVARAGERAGVRVVIAGATVSPDRRAADLPAGAELTGPLSRAELAELMARAGIYALPALYEPFGLSALEAALAGAALVLGAIPSLEEVWGDAATYVPPDDDEALARALGGLARSPELRAIRAAAARERALALGEAPFVERTLSVYRRARAAREARRAGRPA
jgi:glycosyltransferase involved in cell wall biosynthesis